MTHFINGFCITEKMILGIFKKNGSIVAIHEKLEKFQNI
jgi:hypothetical protein